MTQMFWVPLSQPMVSEVYHPFWQWAGGEYRCPPCPLPAGPKEQVLECSSCVRGSVHGPLGASNP